MFKAFTSQIKKMFPFFSVFDDKVAPHQCPASLATRALMLSQFEEWEDEAKKMVDGGKDIHGNAATFLRPGNFDVIGSIIERWRSYPMFVFFDTTKTIVTAFAAFQMKMFEDEKQNVFASLQVFAVNPKYYGKGIGSNVIKRLLKEHQSPTVPDIPGHISGIILLSELSSVGFWRKMGFEEFESDQMCTNLDDVKKMKFIF